MFFFVLFFLCVVVKILFGLYNRNIVFHYPVKQLLLKVIADKKQKKTFGSSWYI